MIKKIESVTNQTLELKDAATSGLCNDSFPHSVELGEGEVIALESMITAYPAKAVCLSRKMYPRTKRHVAAETDDERRTSGAEDPPVLSLQHLSKESASPIEDFVTRVDRPLKRRCPTHPTSPASRNKSHIGMPYRENRCKRLRECVRDAFKFATDEERILLLTNEQHQLKTELREKNAQIGKLEVALRTRFLAQCMEKCQDPNDDVDLGEDVDATAPHMQLVTHLVNVKTELEKRLRDSATQIATWQRDARVAHLQDLQAELAVYRSEVARLSSATAGRGERALHRRLHETRLRDALESLRECETTNTQLRKRVDELSAALGHSQAEALRTAGAAAQLRETNVALEDELVLLRAAAVEHTRTRGELEQVRKELSDALSSLRDFAHLTGNGIRSSADILAIARERDSLLSALREQNAREAMWQKEAGRREDEMRRQAEQCLRDAVEQEQAFTRDKESQLLQASAVLRERCALHEAESAAEKKRHAAELQEAHKRTEEQQRELRELFIGFRTAGHADTDAPPPDSAKDLSVRTGPTPYVAAPLTSLSSSVLSPESVSRMSVSVSEKSDAANTAIAMHSASSRHREDTLIGDEGEQDYGETGKWAGNYGDSRIIKESGTKSERATLDVNEKESDIGVFERKTGTLVPFVNRLPKSTLATTPNNRDSNAAGDETLMVFKKTSTDPSLSSSLGKEVRSGEETKAPRSPFRVRLSPAAHAPFTSSSPKDGLYSLTNSTPTAVTADSSPPGVALLAKSAVPGGEKGIKHSSLSSFPSRTDALVTRDAYASAEQTDTGACEVSLASDGPSISTLEGIQLLPQAISGLSRVAKLHFITENTVPSEYPEASVPFMSTASVPSPPTASVPSRPTASVSSPPEASIPSRPTASVSSPPEASIPSRPTASIPSRPTASVSSPPEASMPSPPEAAVPSRPTASVSSPPEASMPSPPEASVPSRPTASVSSPPEASVPSRPTASVPSPPEASVPSRPTASVPSPPTASVPSRPTASVSSPPEASIPSRPTASVSSPPEASVPSRPTASVPSPPTATTPSLPKAIPTPFAENLSVEARVSIPSAVVQPKSALIKDVSVRDEEDLSSVKLLTLETHIIEQSDMESNVLQPSPVMGLDAIEGPVTSREDVFRGASTIVQDSSRHLDHVSSLQPSSKAMISPRPAVAGPSRNSNNDSELGGSIHVSPPPPPPPDGAIGRKMSESSLRPPAVATLSNSQSFAQESGSTVVEVHMPDDTVLRDRYEEASSTTRNRENGDDESFIVHHVADIE